MFCRPCLSTAVASTYYIMLWRNTRILRPRSRHKAVTSVGSCDWMQSEFIKAMLQDVQNDCLFQLLLLRYVPSMKCICVLCYPFDQVTFLCSSKHTSLICSLFISFYYTTMYLTQILQLRMVGLLVDNELERILRKWSLPVRGTAQEFSWRKWGKEWKTSVSVACGVAEIQTKHRPNTSPELCRYTTQLATECATKYKTTKGKVKLRFLKAKISFLNWHILCTISLW
jgi:hypothetical protein